MKLTVHYLQYGQTPCMMDSPPASWPEHHKWSGDWSDVTCAACLAGKNIAPTYALSDDGKSITCLRCKRTSHNRNDVEKHYCGHCRVFHDNIWPPARRWWVEHPEPDAMTLTWRMLIEKVRAEAKERETGS